MRTSRWLRNPKAGDKGMPRPDSGWDPCGRPERASAGRHLVGMTALLCCLVALAGCGRPSAKGDTDTSRQAPAQPRAPDPVDSLAGRLLLYGSEQVTGWIQIGRSGGDLLHAQIDTSVGVANRGQAPVETLRLRVRVTSTAEWWWGRAIPPPFDPSEGGIVGLANVQLPSDDPGCVHFGKLATEQGADVSSLVPGRERVLAQFAVFIDPDKAPHQGTVEIAIEMSAGARWKLIGTRKISFLNNAARG